MIPELTLEHPLPQTVATYLRELERGSFKGEIRTDMATRLVAATDNSIYQILPAAVVFPRDAADIVNIFKLADQPEHAAVVFSPRGGGTGTNGQSLSSGIIIDCSKFMNRVLEMNIDQGWVRVEPGVVRDELNLSLKPHGYFFAPNLSPSNRATLGGMINTDACGKGSRVYGRTSTHVLELEAVLCDGTSFTFNPLDPDGLKVAKGREDRIGEIHRLVDDLVTTKKDLIAEIFPEMTRFLTGYNLAAVRDDQDHFHAHQLICGSEGSLAVVTGARLKLTKIPAKVTLAAVKYSGFEDALADAIALLESEPTAIETVDEKILEMARQDVIYYRVQPFIDEGETQEIRTVNLVEYSDDDPEVIARKVARLRAAIDKGESRAIGVYVTDDETERAALWDLRKKGVGLLGKLPGARKPIAFMEDTAVPPQHLADYIRELRELLDSQGLVYAMYGHVDVGCLHVRPALDMIDPADEARVRTISDQVVALVRKYGGIMWAEHGKGFRSEYTPLFFGELYDDLRRVKQAFDPLNKLNPGKVVSPIDQEDVTVAVEAPLKGHFDRQVSAEDRATYEAAFGCNGNAACFNVDPTHIMCPSARITRDRIHSPKGRAALVREWLRRLGEDVDKRPGSFLSRLMNTLSGKEDFSHEVRDAMGGCLSCKACSSQCPLQVDVPEYKAKFLETYYTRYLRSPRDYMVGYLESTLPLQEKLTPLINGALSVGGGLQSHISGLVDPPKLARPGLKKLMKEADLTFLDPKQASRLKPSRSVLILPDAFTAFYEPSVIMATHKVMTHLGFDTHILPYRENGKPLHIKGFLKRFRRIAEDNIAFFHPIVAAGIPVICPEPSIALTWRDEYTKALGRELDLKVMLPQEWLATRLTELKPRQNAHQDPFYLLGHCMEKTQVQPSQQQWLDVFKHCGLDLQLTPVGCCGMAGTYGHEKEHLEESRGIYELSWKPQIDARPKEQGRFIASGYSCRSQVKRFANFKPKHPLEVLASCLG